MFSALYTCGPGLVLNKFICHFANFSTVTAYNVVEELDVSLQVVKSILRNIKLIAFHSRQGYGIRTNVLFSALQ